MLGCVEGKYKKVEMEQIRSSTSETKDTDDLGKGS